MCNLSQNDEQLNTFLETFDIVLLDDQTTNFVNFLLKRIIYCRGAESQSLLDK